MVSPPGQVAPR